MNATRPSETDIARRLDQVLGDVPFLRLRPIPRPAATSDTGFDLSFDLTANGTRWKVLVEVKSSGEARIARGAIQRILAFARKGQAQYGLLAAPYIGEVTRKICKDAGVGFIDLAGNCRLVFDKVFIERRGFPKPEVERRPLRSLFSPKASRVIRVLFEAPNQAWQVQKLAREARVSLGLAAKVKQRLLDLEYAIEQPDGIKLARPEELLRSWADHFASRKRAAIGVYAAGNLSEIEEALRTYCTAKGVRYAFTQFSGAARAAPFTRYTRGSAYVDANPVTFLGLLNWKTVDTGANFTLPWPFDEGVFYGARMIGQDRVVSDIQLYLDVMESKGRGEEAATVILEQKLRPRW